MKIIRPSSFAEGSTAFSRAGSAWYWDKNGVLQTAAANVPRWSYDPTDLTKPPCLLVEPAATNLITYSSNLSAGWTGGAAASLSGFFFGNLPYYYIAKTNSGTSEFRQHYVGARVSMDVLVATLAVRAGTSDRVTIGLYDWTATAYGWGDGADSSISIKGPGVAYYQTGGAFYISGLSATVDTIVTITRTYRTDATSSALLIYPDTVNSSTIGASVQVTRVQVEKDRSTSLIPTAGSAVTRAADVFGDMVVTQVAENDYPLFSATKLYLVGDRIINTTTHRIYESSTGQQSTTARITAPAGASLYVNWPAHGLAANTPIAFTAGALPSSATSVTMALNTVYYVVAKDADSFYLSDTVNGVKIYSSAASATDYPNLTARASLNYNQDPTTTTTDYWIDAGPTNKYAVIDQSVSTQTSASDFVGHAFKLSGALNTDSVVIQNIEAGSARVTMTSSSEGLVYDQAVSLVQDLDVSDYWSYCFEPIVRKTDVLFSDLPPYFDATLSVSVAATGETCKTGLVVWGLSKDFGPTQAGMSLGVQDYSVKSADEFGYFTLLERAYSKTMTLTAFVKRTAMNSLINLLISLRATPVVYIGDETLSASFQYGFAKDWSMGADYPEESTLHIEIESLT